MVDKWRVTVALEDRVINNMYTDSFEGVFPAATAILCFAGIEGPSANKIFITAVKDSQDVPVSVHAVECARQAPPSRISFSAPEPSDEEDMRHIVPAPENYRLTQDAQALTLRKVTGSALVPSSSGVHIPHRFILNSCLQKYADLHWVVLAAFMALMSGVSSYFIGANLLTLDGIPTPLRVRHPAMLFSFLCCAIFCVTLFLHRVNLALFLIVMRSPEPYFVAAFLARQWFVLTQSNLALRPDWATWSDDLTRASIDVLYMMCITMVDAWDVPGDVKVLFLCCCSGWALWQLFSRESIIAFTQWSTTNIELPFHYRGSWVYISIFVLKAIISRLSGFHFTYIKADVALLSFQSTGMISIRLSGGLWARIAAVWQQVRAARKPREEQDNAVRAFHP
eukprot:TRINITY_DN1896_c0_g2_i1.p1 TRINITY_DN1896_c0_g2~~TRINITY_DN1896_c0_g2_i1.p1  ORF type:complete len:395 (-),score=41.17 TRINITY_DN1896_c0_g2_i1:117-1301(-)